jgi:hypothetical protein
MEDPLNGDSRPPGEPGSLPELWRVMAETGIPQMSVRERRAFPRSIAWHLDQERREADVKARARNGDLFWAKLAGLIVAGSAVVALLEQLLLTWFR